MSKHPAPRSSEKKLCPAFCGVYIYTCNMPTGSTNTSTGCIIMLAMFLLVWYLHFDHRLLCVAPYFCWPIHARKPLVRIEVKQTAKHTTKAGTKAAQARQVETQDDWIKNIKIKSCFKDQDHQLLENYIKWIVNLKNTFTNCVVLLKKNHTKSWHCAI